MPQLSDLALKELEAAADAGRMPSPSVFAKLLSDLREARNLMPTGVEVYPLACDETGLYLLDSQAWTTKAWEGGGYVQADSEPHVEAERLLERRGVNAPLLHYTSCRTVIGKVSGRSWQVNTLMAGVEVDGLIYSSWPKAEPIDLETLKAWGLPQPHASNQPPVVNDANVLMHGLRHLKWLSNPENDATNAAELERLGFPPHLEPFSEDLARMFRQVHAAA